MVVETKPNVQKQIFVFFQISRTGHTQTKDWLAGWLATKKTKYKILYSCLLVYMWFYNKDLIQAC